MGIIVLLVLFGMTVLVRFPHLEVKSLHSPLVTFGEQFKLELHLQTFKLFTDWTYQRTLSSLLVSELDHATAK